MPDVTAAAVTPDDAVARLFRDHYLALVRLAVQLVDDRETAEDVVQDVFAGYSAAPRTPEDPLRYLRVAVLNRSRSVLRRRRTARLLTPFAPSDAEPADVASLREDEHRRVLSAVRRLPARQREVVVLRYYEQLSVAETAGLLGIAPGAVSTSLARALTTLTRLLEA